MLELRAGDAVVDVDPEGGGRIVRLAVGGRDLLHPGGCFVMAPWAGRTGRGRFAHDGVEHHLPIDMPPHAIHGTVRGVAWAVDDASPSTARLSAPLGPVWPWGGRCTHELTVHDDHLALALEVTADGTPFPATTGWHPWFVKPDAVELVATAMHERGTDHLPTGRLVPPVPPGERPLDDCFVEPRWPVVLRWGDGRSLAVEADGCDRVVVYDEPHDTTCVEPQTAAPDALRQGGAATVAPGAPLRAAMRWRWT